MLYAICLGLFLPLAGFLILMSASSSIGRRLTSFIGCATVFISFVCFAGLLYAYHDAGMNPQSVTLFSWIPVDKINADFKLLLDPLSILMTLIITGVGFLIHVYSAGYMDHEEDFARYFACMNFFVFSMLLLVLAGDLLLLFVGWEGVGLASYLLIGFDYYRPAAAEAATKAFVVNRIGDLGFLLGLLLTFYLFGTGDITEISKRAGQEFARGAPIITVLTLLYFVGATGKSAQIPLHVWLPDAMEGPTPVSALIHAATMVTAGVYLVVRMHEVFILAPLTMQVIGIIGAVTALFASLCALGQMDLKRVLAYSTVSQLGLMFLACGAGAFYAAMFHLTMHAFVKALLFLAAGNIVHMLHGTTDMAQMGGLFKIFTKTRWLLLIGVLSLSGIPMLAAFFSKDLILEQEYLAGHEALFYIGLSASILTGFYLTRAYCLTFFGESHLAKDLIRIAKEAPMIMIIPVSILAVLSLIGGFLGFRLHQMPVLEGFLGEIDITLYEEEFGISLLTSPLTWLSMIGAILGVGIAAIVYTRYTGQLGPTLAIFKKSFWVDEIYEKTLVQPLKKLSRFIADFFEPKVFDGSLLLTTHATQVISRDLQKMQSGQIRSYVAWMALGAALLIVYFVVS